MNDFKVGIIGCGAIFFKHAYPLHKLANVQIEAVCDINPAALEIASTLFDCYATTDYKEIIDNKNINVVHILTPHHLHAPMIIEAVNAGKHVLAEKPMAITENQAESIVQAVESNKVTVGIISQNRYNASSIAIKEAISNGSLGKVLGQRIVLSWYKPDSYYANSAWRGTWDKEGGSLMIDQAIHVMDLARWFIDDDIKSVQATISNHNHPTIQTEDTSEGLVTYQNGVKSVFFATNNYTFNSPVVVETHCENGIALMEFDKAVISFKNGKEIIVLNDPKDELSEDEFKDFFSEESSKVDERSLNEWGIRKIPITWKAPRSYWGISHTKQINNFYDSLSSSVKPDITASEAIKTQRLICAIYQSAKENRTIEFK